MKTKKSKEASDILRILDEQSMGMTMLERLKTKKVFEVLIASVLSVRSRDEQTTKVVEELFKKHNTPRKIAKAKSKELESILRPIGFYRLKTKRIQDLSKKLLYDYNGVVPNTMQGLLTLPGVGRKVAGCVLVYSFKKNAIPVDIHVHRVSNRIGLVKTKKPEDTEKALMKLILVNEWKLVNELFVLHGQKTCKPIKPNCTLCAVIKHCDRRGVTNYS
ncbi:endonuclease III [Candidatus Woesearchaeota archaeon]|nr:endonuclease III [Candidatus Woesearchaeota archaeon]